MALEVRPGITLYFCRHGETEANVAKRFQGHTVDTPLTKKGLQQACDIAEIVRADVTDFAALDYVCSPLKRAQTTIGLIRRELGLPPDGFRTDARLVEIDLGAWDGLTDAEAAHRFPKEYAARAADKWNVFVPGGGENYAAVAKRVSDFVTGLERDTFAVSHGAATRILRGLFAGLDWRRMSALDEPQGCLFRVRGSEVVRLDLPSAR
ncbi:MAG: histidine phosphatase family protein [Rhizomicrobium sp.]